MTPTSTDREDDILPGPAKAAAPYFALCLAVFAAYSNIFENAFLFDDDLLIKINEWLRGWSHIGDLLTGSTTGGAHIAGGFYRPVQMTLYLIIYNLFGASTYAFHTLNLSLHMANACLVYRLGEKLKFKTEGVFLAALIWAVHPLHTEAITYMSATADPLFAFFCLSAIVIWLPNMAFKDIWKVIPLFILGILSKETTVMFPLLAMSCIYLTSPERLKAKSYFKTWPIWAISLVYVAWRMNAKGFDGPQTYDHYYNMREFASMKMYSENLLARFYTFLATLPNYLQLLVKPTGLHMERAFGVYISILLPTVIMGGGILIAAATAVFYSMRKHFPIKALSWGLIWFAAAHSPDTGLLIPMNSLFLEHWMYLPSVGLFLGIGQTLTEITHNKSRTQAGISLACIAFTAILSVMTYNQNAVWLNPATFYNNIFDNGEESARARNNLALYHSGRGETAKAIEQFTRAIKASDSYAETRYNLALTYLKENQHANADKAIENLNRSLEIDSGFYRSYHALGAIYELLKGDKQKAAEYRALAETTLNKRK